MKRIIPVVSFLSFLIMFTAGICPGEEITFIHTADLGDVFAGTSDDVLAPTPEEARETLDKLKNKYPEAAIIDSGNFHGPMSLTETPYTFHAITTLSELGPVAINYGSRDMLYENYVADFLGKEPGRDLPIVSLADFPRMKREFRPKESIRAEVGDVSCLFLGLADPERAKACLERWTLRSSTKNQQDKYARQMEELDSSVDLVVLLSDMHPRRNDELAMTAKPNTIIFEQSVYGVNAEDTPAAVRWVNGIPIVSKGKWWTADVVRVSVGADGRVNSARVKGRPYNARFGKKNRSLFARMNPFLSRPPKDRETRVSLPRLAHRIKYFLNFRQLNLGEDAIQEFRAREVPGAKERENANVYYYRLVKDKETLQEFMGFYQTVVRNSATLMGFVSFDEEGRLAIFKPRGRVHLRMSKSRINDWVEERFTGKKPEEIQFSAEDIYGLEHNYYYLVKNLKDLRDLYPLAKSNGVQITDPYDIEDFK